MTSSALLPFHSSAPAAGNPAAHQAATPSPQERRSLFRAVLEAVADANQRRAERAIAAYVARNGGRLTDDLERRIERSFL
jgi:hypothetical protein